ncbi:MAG: hypothetical protein R3C15_07425 [Thermoleophilia bacterium]
MRCDGDREQSRAGVDASDAACAVDEERAAAERAGQLGAREQRKGRPRDGVVHLTGRIDDLGDPVAFGVELAALCEPGVGLREQRGDRCRAGMQSIVDRHVERAAETRVDEESDRGEDERERRREQQRDPNPDRKPLQRSSTPEPARDRAHRVRVGLSR